MPESPRGAKRRIGVTIKTHLLLSALVGFSLYETVMPIPPTLPIVTAYTLGIFLGTILPDIDEPNSYVGKRSFFVSDIFSTFVRHRGVTHFLFAPVVIWWVGTMLENYLLELLFKSIALGWLSHLLGDLLVGNGVKGFLFPIYSGRITFYPKMNFVVVGGLFEFVLQILFSVLLIIVCIDKLATI